MPPPAPEIRNAREAVERILDELGVRAFVYSVEPKESGWILSIECATNGDWQTVALAVDAAELSASLDDPAIRQKLCAEWRPHVRACTESG
jgi:hypothetical protein